LGALLAIGIDCREHCLGIQSRLLVLESPKGGATLVACLFTRAMNRRRAGKEELPWLTELIDHLRRGAIVAGVF
jgi:hypothetical protein